MTMKLSIAGVRGKFTSILCTALLLVGTPESWAADPKPHFYGKVVALCFGVENYQEPFKPLNSAVRDAHVLAAAMTSEFGFQSLVPPEEANTKQGIFDAIKDAAAPLGEKDALIIYFAGHGVSFQAEDPKSAPSTVRTGFLIPFGATLDFSAEKARYRADELTSWTKQCISMRDLSSLIASLQVHHVVLIIDACAAGYDTLRGGTEIKEAASLFTSPSRSILAATKSTESAREGVFTSALVGILKQHSKDRAIVSLTDVFEELRSKVSRAQGARMTPQLTTVGLGEGEFVFFPLSIGSFLIRGLERAIETGESAPSTANSDRGLQIAEDLLARQRQRSGRQTTINAVVSALTAPNYWYGTEAALQTGLWKQKRDRFERDASFGDPLAMAGLHLCYAKGLGEKTKTVNTALAFQWAQEADLVQKPPGVGKYLLGRCYYNGIGVPQDRAVGKDLFRQSANVGFVLGQVALAHAMLRDQPTARDARTAEQLLQPAIQQELSHAMVVLGDAYVRGDQGLPRDLNRAVRLYETAYQQGNFFPAIVLYDAYGAGLPGYPRRDPKRAENYLRGAADAGLAAAQFYLAVELYHVPNRRLILNLPRNTKEGKVYLERAASQGMADAAFVVAQLYADGGQPEFPKDPDRARAALEVAVAQNLPPAVATQGWWYLEKPEMYPRNEQKAKQLLLKAAATKDALACGLIGEMYEKGMGLDYQIQPFEMHPLTHHGLHWYIVALENGGHEHATKRLKLFAGLLRLEQQGVPYDRKGWGPTQVIRMWKKDFPDTAAIFTRDFTN